jgi:hypothetical protein
LAQGTPADLTATPAGITVTVLAGNESPSISAAIIASQTIPMTASLGASMLGDLVRDDSAARIPSSAVQINVTRETTDTADETFVLTLTPKLSGVAPGRYTGSIRVTGPNVNPLVIPVTFTIQGGSWLEALALLLLGLLLGWLLKWYADTGSKLSAETRRYNSVLRKIGNTPTANLPQFVLNELGDVTQGFSDADQVKVDAALTLLEGQVESLAAVTDVVAHLKESIQAHDVEIQQRPAFAQIPTNERRRLNDALNEATDLMTAKNSVSELLSHAIAITTCLQDAADAGHANVLDLYNQDRFDEALNAFNGLPAAAAPARPAPAAAVVPAPGNGAVDPARLQKLLGDGRYLQAALAAPVGAPPPAAPDVAAPSVDWQQRISQTWRTFLNRWLPLIIGIVTVIFLGLVGLKTQWSSNVTFGSGGAIDDVALVFWGVAAFISGKTLSDFLSSVVSP